MSNYIPDKWIVVKITGYTDQKKPVYKVFACWYGGYLNGDSWKLNSGITKVTLEGNVYSFDGYSGSAYDCHKDLYGTNFYGHTVLEGLIERSAENGVTIEVMPEDTNWMELDYDE
jgi:hypothetical protein